MNRQCHFILLVAVWAGLFLFCADFAPAEAAEGRSKTLSKAPKLVRFVEAVPPASLAERGKVDVVLNIDIDEKGKVTQVTVGQSAGDEYDRAAAAAAKQFEFEPGEFEHKPVPVRITYRYSFLLKPKPEPVPEVGPTAPSTNAPKGPTAPLAGTVFKKGERIPLGGVHVTVVITPSDERTTTTDTQGHFTFDGLPLGEHTIKLRGSDIQVVDTQVVLKAGTKTSVTYYVTSRDRYSSTVRGKRVVVETVEQTLTTDEIKHIPGTQGDTLKAVQNLPGVARSPFGGGLLVVWGSAPQDTRTYVDGVYIPTLYHFGGLRSTIGSDFVQSLTFLPGGYGVDHGLGLGGVVDVTTLKPRTDGYHGFVQLDLLDGSFKLEGPIGKKVSFAIGARRSWIDAFLPLFTTSDFQLSPIYYDYQARVSYRPTSRDDLDLFLFGSDDAVTLELKRPDPNLSAQFNTHNYYHRGVISWLHRFAGRATFSINASVGYDVPFQIQFQRGNSITSVDAETLEYTVRAVARLPLASFLRLDAGVDFEGNRFSIDRTGSATLGQNTGGGGGNGGGLLGGAGVVSDSLTLFTNHPAPFLSATFSFFDNRLTITPQFRLEIFSFTGYRGTPNEFSSGFVAPEPRLQLRYQLHRMVALKASVGVYHQAPDPQAMSRFFGSTKLEPQFGLHYVFGIEVNPTSTLHITAEGFYKDLRQLVVSGERSSDPVLVNDGVGRVYGGELLVRQELWKNFFGWISYTVSRSDRKEHPDVPWHVFQYDQTHILTLIASYKLPRGYQVGVRFRYVTGNPYTAVQGAYYDSNADRYSRIPGASFGARLPSFNQLDVRFDKTWTFNRWKLSLYLDIQNLYNEANVEGVSYNYNFTKQNTITGLPFLPVLGLRGDF